MFVAHFATKRPISLKSAESPAFGVTSHRGAACSPPTSPGGDSILASAGAGIDLELVFAPVLFESKTEGLSRAVRAAVSSISLGVVHR